MKMTGMSTDELLFEMKRHYQIPLARL